MAPIDSHSGYGSNERDEVMRSLYRELGELNNEFSCNSRDINTAAISKLLKKLARMNQAIEIEKQANRGNRQTHIATREAGKISSVVWITIGLEVLAFLFMAGVEILNYISSSKIINQMEDIEQNCNATLPSTEASNLQMLSIIKIILCVAALALLFPGVNAAREILNEYEKAELSSKISTIEMQNKKLLEFFESFNAFKETAAEVDDASEEVLEELFSNCIHNFDQVPTCCEFKLRIPSREHWISLMLRFFPENHLVKTLLNQIHELVDAESLSENFSSEEPLVLRYSSYTGSADSFTPSNTASSKAYSADSSCGNIDSAEHSDNAYSGSYTSTETGYSDEPHRRNTASSTQSDITIEGRKTPRQLRGEQIARPYESRSDGAAVSKRNNTDSLDSLWKTLEKTLGVNIAKIQLTDRIAVDKYGNIAGSIRDLESDDQSIFISPSYSDTTISSLYDV